MKRQKEEDEELKRQKDEIHSQRRHYYLFEILTRLGLILLSPILASAIWLFLVQAGVQGQTVLWVLDAVIFSIGLITEEGVRFIVNSSKKYLGAPTKFLKKALSPKLVAQELDRTVFNRSI